MRVELSCAVCNGNNFSLIEAVADESPILCRDCGHEVGTFGYVKELLLAALKGPQMQDSEIVVCGEDERKPR